MAHGSVTPTLCQMSGRGRRGRTLQSGAEAEDALGCPSTQLFVDSKLVGLLKGYSHFLQMNSQVYHPGCTSLVAFNFIKVFTCGASGQEVGQH